MANDMKLEQESGKAVQGKSHEPPLTAREEWIEFLKTAAIAVLLALLIRTFFLEPFNIPSGSMKPTLEVGDYLFVSKPAYGYSRYSFPFGLAPIEDRIWTRGNKPKRGDVIVFKLPTNTSIDYIKRIVALPGETVRVTNGRLYINRKLVEREALGLTRMDEDGVTTTMMEYIETLPGGIMHRIYEESDNRPLDNTEEYVVPEGHYFAMGDNRDNSQDSRVSNMVGFVPLENIVGRASFIFFSTNGSARPYEFWKWPWTVRYSRLLEKIEPVRPPAE
jgi:signal peptidase I